MTHTHAFQEITAFGHTERHFRCAFCATEITKPFPEVNPSTGVVTEAHYCKDCRSEFSPGDLDARDGFCSRSCEMAFYDRLNAE